MSGGKGKEVGGGHDASGEEVTRHPIVGVLGFVKEGVGVMGEDMDEDFGVGLEPGGDLGEELTVVANVLEHFNRDEAVEGSAGLEVIDIAGDDFEVVDATGAGLCFNVLALGLGIGNSGDFSAGVAGCHEEAEGTPTAAQFEDVLPVAKFGAFAGEGEHRDFRCFEGIALLVPVGGTVFEVGAEGFEEIGGGDFVVLFVGGGGVLREGELGEMLDPVGGGTGLRFELAEFAAQALANAVTDERVGKEAFFSE